MIETLPGVTLGKWGSFGVSGPRHAGQIQLHFFPITRENSCNWHFWHGPGAVLAAQENGWEASRRCQSLLGFSFLFLKVGIKAKGFRQYKCQSSCFSLLYFFNEMVYSSQMICNQFIGFNYCVKKKKKAL